MRLACCLAVLSAAPALAASAGPAPADLIFKDAAVLTMDPARPTAQAVAVRGPYLIYVGDSSGVEALRGPKTRVVSGGTVLPGLIDAHAHLVGYGLSLRRLDLRGLTSPKIIADRVRGASGTGWVLGRGWDQNLFPDRALPTHEVLDQAAPGRPVYLRRIDGHAAWASAAALRLSGISAQTPDPPGGRIVRDADGRPTGVLIDNAMDLVERGLPSPGAAELESAILEGARRVMALGLTAVHEMGLGGDEIAAYQRLADAGRLPLRVYGFYADPIPAALAAKPDSAEYREKSAQLLPQLGPPRAGPFFSLRGVKLYADGALGSRGAALFSDYSDDHGNRGLLVSPQGHIRAMAQFAASRGLQVATHAIGDRAVHDVLEAYQQAGVSWVRDLRFRIEHVQVLAEDDLRARRFAELGVLASVQPTHATSDMPWAGARLGSERLLRAYAWRRLLDSGARLCAGSDFPVEEPDPRMGLHAAVTRQDPSLNPPGGFVPQERLTLGEALRAFTSDAAYAAFWENQLGTLQAGRLADLTVLGGTLTLAEPRSAALRATDAAPTDLPRRPVRMTVINGRVVYDGERSR